MSGNYSLRGGRGIGVMTPPSAYTLTAAVGRERDITSQMSQPGANQMIGYRFAAQADREAAEQEYNLGLERHNETLLQHREQDYERALENRNAAQQHAIRTAAINNPAGAAASGDESVYSLVSPEYRGLSMERMRAEIAAANRRGTGGDGNAVLTPNAVLSSRRQVVAGYEARESALLNTFANQERNIRAQAAFAPQQIAERDRQLAALVAERQRAIAELRARRDAELSAMPNIGPDGRVQMPQPPAANAPPTGAAQTPPTGAGGAAPPTGMTGTGTRVDPFKNVPPGGELQLPPGSFYTGTDGALRQRRGMTGAPQ